ncbi:MAG TPA: AI-2E family transporter [Candidatus Limnocylindrales bacterium]|nr:AI-2E family transporter [Candidatus Limnocylindrales bacterium]
MPKGAPVLVPAWLVRSADVGWRLLATAGIAIVVGIVASTIPVSTTATLVSLVFAAAIAPTTLRLRDRGLPRMVAAGISFGAGAVLIVATVVVLLLVLVPDLRAVATAVGQGLDAVRDRLADAGAPDQVSLLVDRLGESLQASLVPDTGELAGLAANVGTVLVLGFFLTFFLLADGDKGWSWAVSALRPDQVEAVSASARGGLDRVAWYIRRTALLAAVDGVVVGVVLTVMGVPLAGALGSVAFLAGFVPYLGAVAGGSVIALAALALGGPAAAIAVLAALVVAWVVATRLLDRTAMGRVVDVSPVLVLVAIPAGVALFGVLGLLAVLPVTVFAIAISRSVIAALGLRPAIAPGGADGVPGAAQAELPEGVPLWLDRLAQWSWRGLVLAGLAWLSIVVIVRIPSVVVPAVMAVVGAATLLPIVSRLVAGGRSRGFASALATVGAVAFIVVAVGAAVAMTLGPLREVVDAAVAGAAELDMAAISDAVLEIGRGLEVDLAVAVLSLTALSIAMLLAILMIFFFLRDGGGWWRAATARLGPGRREPIAEAGRRAVDVLAGYMIGTAAISAFGGITSGLILVILGLPLAVPIAVIGFFAGFIPYIGSFVTTALALLVTVALGDTQDIVIMLIFTVIFNIAQGNFVTPLVYGKSLSLHPAVVLMAIPVGNEIAGILGMFLVVPAAAMVAATWRLLIAAIDERGLTTGPGAEAGPDTEPGAEAGTSTEAGPGTGARPAADPAPAGT